MPTNESANNYLHPTYSTEPNRPISVLSAYYCSLENNRPHQSSRGWRGIGVGLRRADLVKEAIEPLPLFGGDFLADLAGVLPGSIHAVDDGRGIAAAEDEMVRHGLEVAAPLQSFGTARRR